MLLVGPTESPAAAERASNHDLTLSHVVPKPPGSGPKTASLKRKYEGLLKEDLCGKWVRKELQKLQVSQPRFDDPMLHGQTRTRDPKLMQMRR